MIQCPQSDFTVLLSWNLLLLCFCRAEAGAAAGRWRGSERYSWLRVFTPWPFCCGPQNLREMQAFILMLLGLQVDCKWAKLSLDGQLSFRLPGCLTGAYSLWAGPRSAPLVSRQEKRFWAMLWWSLTQKEDLLCWFGLPQVELEIGLGCSELWKVVSGSTSEGVQSETKKRENGKPPMNPWTGFSTRRRSIIED